MMTRIPGFILGALALSVPASAQTARPMLDYASAAKMRDACVAYAAGQGGSISIAVYDEELRLISFGMMDGASNASSDLAHWKGKAAASYRVASADLANWNAPNAPGIATFPGGVPVFTADGKALGAVGVSGMSPSEDVACARAGLEAAGLKETAKQGE
jgi:uncharacterized protein GlcG (DUF336 family)